MKRKIFAFTGLAVILLTGCGESAVVSEPESSAVESAADSAESTAESAAAEDSAPAGVASGDDVIEPEAVGYEGMEPVYADALVPGSYSVAVDSSSSMFKITDCFLTVADEGMTAKLTMSGSGYEALYPGTAAEAAASDSSAQIPFTEENGVHCFVFPVAALDQETDCAAFSTKKQLWYDRKLVFRADSLPEAAFAAPRMNTAEALGLADGEYTVSVTLEGGSGKASVQSPAKLTVQGGAAVAELIWSSNQYDYMLVDGEKYLPVSTEEFSVFEIPVKGFDYKMPVSADTTAMSVPYEIEYTLYFDSATIS